MPPSVESPKSSLSLVAACLAITNSALIVSFSRGSRFSGTAFGLACSFIAVLLLSWIVVFFFAAFFSGIHFVRVVSTFGIVFVPLLRSFVSAVSSAALTPCLCSFFEVFPISQLLSNTLSWFLFFLLRFSVCAKGNVEQGNRFQPRVGRVSVV